MKLSGAEDVFDTRPWDTAVDSDNCYDYAIGDFERNRKMKSTPGNRAGIPNDGNFTSCKGLRQRILADNPGKIFYMPDPSKDCKPGFYRIMNFVSPNGGDFHFYKQIRGVRYKVKSGDTPANLSKFFRVKVKDLPTLVSGKTIIIPVNLWAHKRGWGEPPLLTDAKGMTIKDPRRCNRNYPGLNYSSFCGCYQVKRGFVRSGIYKTRRDQSRYGFPSLLKGLPTRLYHLRR